MQKFVIMSHYILSYIEFVCIFSKISQDLKFLKEQRLNLKSSQTISGKMSIYKQSSIICKCLANCIAIKKTLSHKLINVFFKLAQYEIPDI